MSVPTSLLDLNKIVSSVIQSEIGIIDDSSSDCEFKGPCQKKTDCYERCGVGKPPFKIALCEPSGSSRVCCCI
ncbi:hypothetical protein Bca52824_073362 [Brassica carinata]|uniref:Uncharacterized protein n=1 Tax=Brassica carinata TaxID=52824 RepID=A0A8X7QDX7_BRACI|nr:hypothetical protein Bca52824_073362 [Brassica carinata]